MRSHNILLVDDDVLILKSLKRALLEEERVRKYNIFVAKSPSYAFKILDNFKIHLVISDEKMPEMLGHDFLKQLRILFPHTMRIMLTGQADLKVAMKAINYGEIYRFLTKPWNGFELSVMVRQALNLFDLEEKNRYLLNKVNQQANIFHSLEKIYPEITKIKSDLEEASINSDFAELTNDEINELINQYEQEVEGFPDKQE